MRSLSRKDQVGPPAFWARRRSKVRRSCHRSRRRCSRAGKSGRLGTARKGLGGDIGGKDSRWPCGAIHAPGSIIPAMQSREARAPGGRSPFVAAVLSFLFPGLGQAYAGFGLRAVAMAAPLVLLLALVAGAAVSRPARDWLVSELADPTVLQIGRA